MPRPGWTEQDPALWWQASRRGSGLASSSIGTSGVLVAHTDGFTPDPSGRIHAFGHAVPGAYHVMGVTLAAGASLSRLLSSGC